VFAIGTSALAKTDPGIIVDPAPYGLKWNADGTDVVKKHSGNVNINKAVRDLVSQGYTQEDALKQVYRIGSGSNEFRFGNKTKKNIKRQNNLRKRIIKYFDEGDKDGGETTK